MTATALKILTIDQWAQFQTDAVFLGAPVDLADGYIHLSTADQLDETLARHFAMAGRVIIAEIDLLPYGRDVRWEPSRGGQLFPHIYSVPLQLDTVRTWHERPAATIKST